MIGQALMIKSNRGNEQVQRAMRWRSVMMAAGLALAAPAAAQFTQNDQSLVNAIRDGDGGKMISLITGNSSDMVNRRGFDGATPLTAAIERRRTDFMIYLLTHGANPDFATTDGNTPVIAATQLGWSEGAGVLLSAGAKVDSTNRNGETALIIAVQNRSLPLVHLLIAYGADPDKADHASGMNARDYARRDNRVRDLARILDAVPKGGIPKKPSL